MCSVCCFQGDLKLLNYLCHECGGIACSVVAMRPKMDVLDVGLIAGQMMHISC